MPESEFGLRGGVKCLPVWAPAHSTSQSKGSPCQATSIISLSFVSLFWVIHTSCPILLALACISKFALILNNIKTIQISSELVDMFICNTNGVVIFVKMLCECSKKVTSRTFNLGKSVEIYIFKIPVGWQSHKTYLFFCFEGTALMSIKWIAIGQRNKDKALYVLWIVLGCKTNAFELTPISLSVGIGLKDSVAAVW